MCTLFVARLAFLDSSRTTSHKQISSQHMSVQQVLLQEASADGCNSLLPTMAISSLAAALPMQLMIT